MNVPMAIKGRPPLLKDGESNDAGFSIWVWQDREQYRYYFVDITNDRSCELFDAESRSYSNFTSAADGSAIAAIRPDGCAVLWPTR